MLKMELLLHSCNRSICTSAVAQTNQCLCQISRSVGRGRYERSAAAMTVPACDYPHRGVRQGR